MVKIAIVGASGSHWAKEQKQKVIDEIRAIFNTYAKYSDKLEDLDYSNITLVMH